MNDNDRNALGMRVHSIGSDIEAILTASKTPEGRDELGMMLKTLTLAYSDLGKVLQQVGYATGRQIAAE